MLYASLDHYGRNGRSADTILAEGRNGGKGGGAAYKHFPVFESTDRGGIVDGIESTY